MQSLSVRSLTIFLYLGVFSISGMIQPIYLTESQLLEAIVDHTLIGNDWAEYYSSKGLISGRARFLGFTRNYQGRWKISGDKICYTYEDPQFNTCSKLEQQADSVIHYQLDAKQKKDVVAKRVKGNLTSQL